MPKTRVWLPENTPIEFSRITEKTFFSQMWYDDFCKKVNGSKNLGRYDVTTNIKTIHSNPELNRETELNPWITYFKVKKEMEIYPERGWISDLLPKKRNTWIDKSYYGYGSDKMEHIKISGIPDETVFWKYGTLGSWRGSRGTKVFNIENRFVRVLTQEGINLPNGGYGGKYFLYDNDVTDFIVNGNNGRFEFNHLYPFNVTTWHDDYHRGHETVNININCNNSVIVLNYFDLMRLNAPLAADTRGNYFKFSGNDNIIFINVYDESKFALAGKVGLYSTSTRKFLGSNYYSGSSGRNTIVVNTFGNGKIETP